MAERTKNGPYWVKAWIADLSQLTDMFRDEDGKVDYEALGREEYQFRMALARKDFSISVRAKKVWDEALGPYQQRIGAARKDKESTADATTREDVKFKSDSGNAGNLESATSAKPSMAYAGKNGLVRLTDDEYALLLQELGNKRKADRLIDDLDYKLAEGATFRQPHLHVLTHWQSYREDKAAEAAEMAKVNADARAEAFSKRGYKTAEERQQEELAKINDFCTGLRNGTIKIAKEG